MADIWGKIKSLVSTTAPILGNAIIPGIGGTAISMISKMLGCDPNDPKNIEAAINGNPETLLKLKELEAKNEQFLLKASQENDKMYIADTQNARNREIQLAKETGKMNWPMYVLGGLVVIGFFGTVIGLFTVELMVLNKELVIYTVGGLQSAFITIIAYFYGSSKGSKDKDHNNLLTTKLK